MALLCLPKLSCTSPEVLQSSGSSRTGTGNFPPPCTIPCISASACTTSGKGRGIFHPGLSSTPPPAASRSSIGALHSAGGRFLPASGCSTIGQSISRFGLGGSSPNLARTRNARISRISPVAGWRNEGDVDPTDADSASARRSDYWQALRIAVAGIACAANLVAPGLALAAVPAPTGPFPCEDVEAYYAPAKGLKGGALKDKLHDVIKGHKVYTYTQVWEALKILDAADEKDPQRSPDIVEIYTRKKVPKALAADGEGWNREHLWPRSYGLVQTEPQFSDLHNLRPSDVNVNSSRGNKWYGECTDAVSGPNGDYCLRPANREAASDTAATKQTWSPPSEVLKFESRGSDLQVLKVRGDIARALLYMAVRYDGKGDSSVDLELSDAPSVAAGRMGLLTPLLRWHTADPPSASEKLRNERVCKMFQHNRNPFVDHPEFVSMIWNVSNSPSPPPVPPSRPATSAPPATSAAQLASAPTANYGGPLPAWLNEFHYDNKGADEGEFIEVLLRPGVRPEAFTVHLYNGNDGKSYASYKLTEFNASGKAGGYTLYHLVLPQGGMQNGPADGVAIVEAPTSGGAKVVQFVTYEGQLVATDGPAKGLKSIDIQVAESDKTPKGASLGLAGSGKDFKEFVWKVFEKATLGALNQGQSISQ